MTRVSPIAFAALAALVISAAPACAELVREVFPVPPVVAAAFRSRGLTAFDPFHPWPAGSVGGAAPSVPCDPGADAARLPPGTCYDVVPAWTGRGFKPHDGTRVLYHSPSQLLFAVIAPEDEALVRAFCEWPPATWMSEPYRENQWVRQILLRITTYAVPATGAADWDFRPATVGEFFALPAAARPIAGRQSMIIRGGQRSKVEGLATPQRNRERVRSGALIEAECTVGEDDSSVDLNLAPEFAARLDDGSIVLMSSLFQQLIEWGNSWLMEAGTLPGNPPRRMFQVCEVLRVNDGMHRSGELAQCRHRWTGRATGHDSSADGRVIELMDFPEPEPPPPVAKPGELLPPSNIDRRAAADPFAKPVPPATGKFPEVTVPELFGEAPVDDVSAAWESAAGIPHGQLHAWSRFGGRHYLHGSRDAMAALQQWLDGKRPSPVMTAVVEATVDVVSVNGGAGKSIWRSTIPTRAGQRSKWMVSPANPGDTDDSPPALAELELEANAREFPGPHISTEDDSDWQLTAAVSLTPPFVDAPVKLDATTATGDRHGVTLKRTIARTASGDSIVLNMRLRSVEFRSRPWRGAPLHEWWWHGQLKKAGR
jgi:hypothetical protein